MTFLPVVERELRVTARRSYTYWSRAFAALATVALCAWVWWAFSDGQLPHERGQILFRFISGLAFAYSIVAGVSITADCLSEEKREGTLGLLFLTDLKGYDVVLGKLAATSLNALYRLFSVFPILSVPLLLGALTFEEVGRMALVLTNTLFFSLSVGVLISSVSFRERRAMLGTLCLILLVTAGPPALGLFLKLKLHNPVYNLHWLLSSCVYSAELALDSGYKAHPRQFWASIILLQLITWCFLGIASRIVRRTWQDRPEHGLQASWKSRWRDWHWGDETMRRTLRERLLSINPILWLGGRDRLKPIYFLAVLGLLALVWLWLWWKFGRVMLDSTIYLLTAYCIHTLIKIWVASEACRLLIQERRSGALELILATPLSVQQILEGELLALRRNFGWPITVALAADLVMLTAAIQDSLWDSSPDSILLFGGVAVMFVADVYTLAWVGLWLGLTARKTNRALSGALVRVLVLPWAIFTFGLTVLATMRWRTSDPSEFEFIAGGLALALVNDLIWYLWARTNLHEKFRLVATQAYETKPTGITPDLQSTSDDTGAPVLAR